MVNGHMVGRGMTSFLLVETKPLCYQILTLLTSHCTSKFFRLGISKRYHFDIHGINKI